MTTKDKKNEAVPGSITWQEESGLLEFLKSVRAEVARFNGTFDLGVELLTKQPEKIDGSRAGLKELGFVVLRKNSALIGRDYCLYSILKGRELHGAIGIHNDGVITTVRELDAVTDYRKARTGLFDWLRQLVKASFDKL